MTDAITCVVLADMHVGSAYAPFPAGFISSTGNAIAPNKGQEYLNRCWADFLQRIPKTIEYLITDGDLIDGQQPKHMARGLTEPDPQWQAQAAAEMLAPLRERARTCYCVSGTPYHVGREDGEWEEWVARQLNAEKDVSGRSATDWLLLDIGGVVLDVAHAQSVATVNTLMPLEREQRHALMLDDERPDVDLIVRAHTHLYRWANIDGRLMLGMPAWKLQSPHVRQSKTPNRYYSRILGGVLLRIWPERKRPGVINRGDYIEHELLWYRHPPLAAVRGGGADERERPTLP